MAGSAVRAAVVLTFCSVVVCDAAAADAIYAATSNGIFKSVNAGVTWIPAGAGLSGIPVFSLAINPDSGTTVYAGTFGEHVFHSTNGGADWTPARAGIADDIVLALAIDPRNPATLYAGTTRSSPAHGASAFMPGRGVFKSSNGAASWSPANTGLPQAVITALAIAPTNPAIVYAGTNVAGVFKTTNGGLTWLPANAGIATSDISHIVVDPRNPDTVYAGLEGCSAGCSAPAGVFKSTNGGMTWISANAGLADDLQVVTLAIHPRNPDVLYAGTRFNGIFKTTNGGRSWTSVSPAPTGTMFAIVHMSIVVDPEMPETVYAGTFDGILKSTDGGKTWNASNNGLPEATRVFALAVR